MDEIKIFTELIKTQGLAGAIAVLFIWDKFIRPQMRKRAGKHFPSEEMNQKIEKLEKTLSGHLEKEAIKDIRIAKMEVEQDHFKERLTEFSADQKSMFALISEIKNFLIQNGG